jgi:pimeloyl-ACP methyl ester carboxylesterase
MEPIASALQFMREPDRPVQAGARPGSEDKEGYTLFIIEFDDQGWYHAADQHDALFEYLHGQEIQDYLIIVFIHGWKHNARPDDENLRSFRTLLQQACISEEQHAGQAEPRRILGIYISWRGLTWSWPILRELTFFGRKATAGRVAVGSVREILARLRQFQDSRSSNDGARTRLVLVGHSFGGLILFSAVSEYLIESAATPGVINPFGDLVILVNPAFEAARYQPLHDIVKRGRAYEAYQRTCFIAITATNDWATGLAFPIGRWFGTFFQSTRDKLQRCANRNTVGHLEWMRTHALTATKKRARGRQPLYTGQTNNLRAVEENDFQDFNRRYRPNGRFESNWTRNYSSGAVLSHVKGDPDSPFWVVSATPDVINGHNGIFGVTFLDFMRQLCDDRLRRINGAPPANPPPRGRRPIAPTHDVPDDRKLTTGVPIGSDQERPS